MKKRRKRTTARRTRRRNASYTARPRRRTRRRISAAPRRRRRNATRIVVRRSNRRRRNQLGGAMAGQVQEIFGGLVGVTATKFISNALPANLKSTPIMASLSSIGAAFAAGWLGGLWNRQFGAAVRFGGLMQAGSVLLNAFIPAIGSQLALQGMRGLGDLVPGAYPVPQNPLNPNQANYPAYGRPIPVAANGTYGAGAPVTMNGVSRAFGRAF